jgi:hypothetical protein
MACTAVQTHWSKSNNPFCSFSLSVCLGVRAVGYTYMQEKKPQASNVAFDVQA